ncbi:MAG: S1/P1 nuclease [Pyrinomonadaceae bacterium]
MRNTILRTAFFAVFLLFAMPALAWDETGHKITAYIAWQRMTPEVREKVIKILRNAPEDSQLATFYMSYGSRTRESRMREFFMTASVWADIIKDNDFETRFDKYAENNSDWHYVNNFWTVKDGKAVRIENMQPAGRIMKKLADFSQLIRGNASDAEKAIAIAWLEHLIGDIHQPLHSSARVNEYDPKGDRGGNGFYLTPKGTKREQQDNLHSFWDSVVVRYMPNPDKCDFEYIEPIAQSITKLYPYDTMRAKLSLNNFENWANESLSIAMNVAYRNIKFGEKPSDKYTKNAFEIAQERLALGGYRLGELFNEAFGAPPAIKVPPIPANQ